MRMPAALTQKGASTAIVMMATVEVAQNAQVVECGYQLKYTFL